MHTPRASRPRRTRGGPRPAQCATVADPSPRRTRPHARERRDSTSLEQPDTRAPDGRCARRRKWLARGNRGGHTSPLAAFESATRCMPPDSSGEPHESHAGSIRSRQTTAIEISCLTTCGRMFEALRSNPRVTDQLPRVGRRAAPGAWIESLVPAASTSSALLGEVSPEPSPPLTGGRRGSVSRWRLKPQLSHADTTEGDNALRPIGRPCLPQATYVRGDREDGGQRRAARPHRLPRSRLGRALVRRTSRRLVGSGDVRLARLRKLAEPRCRRRPAALHWRVGRGARVRGRGLRHPRGNGPVGPDPPHLLLAGHLEGRPAGPRLPREDLDRAVPTPATETSRSPWRLRSLSGATRNNEPHRMPRLASIVYVVLGVIVASRHSYYASFGASLMCSRWWPLPCGRSFSSVRTSTSVLPTCKNFSPARADPLGSAPQQLRARRRSVDRRYARVHLTGAKRERRREVNSPPSSL
jgi:hypothetical protein